MFGNGFRNALPAKSDFNRPIWLFGVILIYWGLIYAVGGLRSDHILVCSLALFLYYWRPGTRETLKDIYPLILSGLLYDSMRYYADYIRGTIHVEQPYWFDKTFFGIHSDGKIFTPNEWWQLHTSVVLDFFCGLAYLIFIFEFMFLCFYFHFVDLRNFAHRATWSFFIVNLMGYTTYYWYAAAPPWYVALYGMGPARMDTLPNPAGTARFDAIFGTHFFTNMYGKSADVFGAVPSLHVTYPFLAMFYAYQMKRFRFFSTSFFLLMCMSAVYLNHHYVLDILWGLVYTLITIFITEYYFPKNSFRTPSKIG